MGFYPEKNMNQKKNRTKIDRNISALNWISLNVCRHHQESRVGTTIRWLICIAMDTLCVLCHYCHTNIWIVVQRDRKKLLMNLWMKSECKQLTKSKSKHEYICFPGIKREVTQRERKKHTNTHRGDTLCLPKSKLCSFRFEITDDR